jgi:hypothetical protein
VAEWTVEKIISGGQTGVDRAALDVAIEMGIPCGGWCPKGRRAEDGRIPEHYPLEETSSAEYPQRTQMNIEDSDGTLVITWGPPAGGTLLTIRLARKHGKPYLLADLSEKNDPIRVREWMRSNGIRVLNVAGPRESEIPDIHEKTRAYLRRVLQGHEE